MVEDPYILTDPSVRLSLPLIYSRRHPSLVPIGCSSGSTWEGRGQHGRTVHLEHVLSSLDVAERDLASRYLTGIVSPNHVLEDGMRRIGRTR